MASFNQSFLFIVLFLAISVNLCWGPNKMQLVMALRDLPIDVAHMKEKLVGLGHDPATISCGAPCKTSADCTVAGLLCINCVPFGPGGPSVCF
ncbi:hypothetical protein HAX54_009390 [Datura stramonium]|uniref:Carboxypeptidase A inhibitor-like domain-containing protein n=1 Tax=Datura stramonium TaxID=4076 RepID=A0ABS8RW95_DATST|nr:hypothetical protein [Datura stramonium]